LKYAVLTDIHSNIEALDAAFAQIPDGYGPNPNECMTRIRERAAVTVLGNHDVAAIDDFGVAYFNPAAREAMRWTQTVLLADHVAWLNGLGYEYRLPECLLVHGAPKEYFEYILDKSSAARAFTLTDAPLVFIGHTHIAEYYALTPDGTIAHRHLQQGGELTLEPGHRYIVNPGSVGQPRDLNPRASFALFDSEARRIDVIRFDYPIERVQEKIALAQLPDALGRRLLVGR
jgi:diadenosine tetraphosphatase ApaH/serine/threonine PP2A family protein phosphatase